MSGRGVGVAAMFVGLGLVTAPVASRRPPSLIWNASASVPVGLYRVRSAEALHLGDVVAVVPPEPLARFLAARGYLPAGVPLLKPVAALAGQIVCRRGGTVTVDGVAIGEAQDRDRRGHHLPVWQGCRDLGGDEIFLMNPHAADSLDGRYFGPVPRASVLGRAVPLWTWADRS
jgi:conjugative transfer signal peptidase TraF